MHFFRRQVEIGSNSDCFLGLFNRIFWISTSEAAVNDENQEILQKEK